MKKSALCSILAMAIMLLLGAENSVLADQHLDIPDKEHVTQDFTIVKKTPLDLTPHICWRLRSLWRFSLGVPEVGVLVAIKAAENE